MEVWRENLQKTNPESERFGIRNHLSIVVLDYFLRHVEEGEWGGVGGTLQLQWFSYCQLTSTLG